ncbi:putative lipase [Geobacter hydrogenophilus]|uniref:esterase/lipase family protein n=1 Tax=Geobacter hydrogenophilus TaxID=40983 RepID=UPI001BDB0321|nr:putative lipase [Geobacter hydrogenophilus]MBT0895443.1 putative lipase [Geobacter hydrogenophilus]
MDNTTTIKITEVDSSDLIEPIKSFDTDCQNRIVIERHVMPIIFVPGIMGSRLQTAAGAMVWDPDDSGFMLKKFGLITVSAAEKKAMVIGSEFKDEYLQVVSESEHISDKNDNTRKDRGWGGVSWSSYGKILKELQNRQWDQTVNLFFEFPVHAFGYNWTASNDLAGKMLAEYIKQVKDRYKGRKCEKVILVTHSMGGLVARSSINLHGAKENVLGVVHGVQPATGSPTAYWRMKAGFERPHTIPDIEFMQWFKNPLKMLKHKWGRLVQQGKPLSELGGLFNIPVPLPDINIGKGNITAWVLGTDGEEVTALLGNMPGGLQLLPNKQYKNNDGWERWLELLDAEGERVAYPVSDPYKEIYQEKEKYYRLINPDWLNPEKKSKSVLKAGVDPWTFYIRYLTEAETFHDKLAAVENRGANLHPETYQFYSSGIASPDRVVFEKSEAGFLAGAWHVVKETIGQIPETAKDTALTLVMKSALGPVSFTKEIIETGASLVSGTVLKDRLANRGGYRGEVDDNDIPAHQGEKLQLVIMKLPDGAGDGTVPESSGFALKPKEDRKRTFCIADKSGFEANFVDEKAQRTKPKRDPDFDEGFFDRGHEPIYKTKSAQLITFTAIENICRREIQNILNKKG